MYSAPLIAAWFVNKGVEEKNYITQMQLQKMLYFAHGLSLHILEKPLVNEQFKAWKYGPVIPELYSIYKQWGSSPITSPMKVTLVQRKVVVYEIDAFGDEVDEILLSAWDITKDIPGEKLSNWTHERNSPWDKCYKQGENTPIPNTMIKEYFDSLMKNA